MLVGINLSNVHILNIDEVIERLEIFRDTIVDGKLKPGYRHRTLPKPTLILDIVFYSEFGSVAGFWSAQGFSVKEYEDGDNEAIQNLRVFVDGNGDFTTEKEIFKEPQQEDDEYDDDK